MISEAEKKRRQECVAYARASMGLENLQSPAWMHAQQERYIDGEISLTELGDFVRKDIRQKQLAS